MSDRPAPNDTELREQLLNLDRPDRLYLGQTIEAKIEDVEALIAQAEARLLERLKGQSQVYTAYIGDGKFKAVDVEVIDAELARLRTGTKDKS